MSWGLNKHIIVFAQKRFNNLLLFFLPNIIFALFNSSFNKRSDVAITSLNADSSCENIHALNTRLSGATSGAYQTDRRNGLNNLSEIPQKLRKAIALIKRIYANVRSIECPTNLTEHLDVFVNRCLAGLVLLPRVLNRARNWTDIVQKLSDHYTDDIFLGLLASIFKLQINVGESSLLHVCVSFY